MDSNTYEVILEKQLKLLEIVSLQGKNIEKLTDVIDKLTNEIIFLKKQIDYMRGPAQSTY